MSDVAPIIGVGDNLGAAIASRFGQEGLHVAGDATSRRPLGLSRSGRGRGAAATGLRLDARDEQAVADLVKSAEADIGPIVLCVFKVGGSDRFPIAETTWRVYRKVWEMCALAGFLFGKEVLVRKEVAQAMLMRNRGTFYSPEHRPAWAAKPGSLPSPARNAR